MSAKITLARAWDWTRLGSPGGGHGAYSLVVDPASDERIVVTTDEGIHASELGPNGVLIWTNTLPGSARALVADPWRPGTLLAASNHDAGQADDCQGYRCLYRSEDWGWTWTLTQRFAQTITSILVSPVDPSTLLVGCNFTEDDPPVGLYLCSASGDSCGLSSFGIDDQVIYLADIAQDDSPTTSNGTIYVSSERHSAPRPYPPFLRSTDYGASWKNLTFRPDNHVMKIETHPQDGRVYAPEEGSQLFISTNQGDSWQIRNNAYFQATMLLDRRRPHRLYGGSISGQGVDGARFSPDGGLTFSNAGLAGVVVSRLALSGSGWVLFAAAYDRDGNDGGVFRSHMDYCPPGVTDDGPVDTDGDGLGDACDSDLDGDGIPNEFDCAPRNRCLGPDLDRDTVCDGWGTHPETGLLCDEPACLYDCGLMYARLGPGAFHLGRCLAECQAPMDNCISPGPAADSDCAAVAASCSSALSETPCDRAAAERCALRYGNPGQESSFGDPLVGDKCKTGIGSLTLSPDYGGGTGFGGGLPVTAVCDRYGDTYSVSMRLWGGEVTTGPGGQVRYQVEDRTAVEAGVCSCTNGTVDGWSDDCRRDECPYRAEFVGEENIKAWNPISAPEIAVKRYVPSEGFQPLYPVYCGDPWDPCDADRVSARENQLVFGRKMPFTRDPARNAHRFTWAWPEARQFPMMTALPLPYGSPGRTTRIRASWPNFGESYLPPFYDTQVTYSRAVPVGASSGNCLGEIYLGPAFIVDRIPGQVDLLPDDRSRTARLPGGWLLGETLAEGRPLLYRLAPGTLHVEAVQELGLPSGVDLLSAPVSSHVGLLPAGLLGAEGKAMTLALALYAPGEPAPPQPPDPPTHEEPPSPASPARLLLGSLESGLVVALTDVAERTGAPTPWLDEAQVVLLPGRGQVLLVGRDPSGASAPVAYRLRLEEGAWSGPHALAGLGNRQGFSIVRDAFGDRLLVFGGRLLGGPVTGGPGTGDPDTGGPSTSVADSADLFALDPDTLIARRLPFDALEGAARSRAGLFLHGEGRQLFVVGGERSGSPLATGFVIDLLRGSAAALDLAAGPGALADPFVYFDDREGRLWVADLVGASISNGLTLWALGEDGLWQAARTSVGVEASSFPAQGSYLAGRASVYFVEAAASADWPGQVFVASLVSSGAQLRLSAQSATADLLCESTGQDTDLEQAAFACLPGSSCRLALSLGTTDEWTGAAVPFTLDVRKAALGPAESRLLPVPATDLVLHRGSLVVTSPLGLGLMDAATLDWTGLATGPGMVAAQAVTTCGSYHCVARLGSEGLKVLDLSDPASPEVKGGALTPGLGWDVAASGARVFVAHGVLGVGIYELGPGGQVFWQQTLFGGGIVKSVAARGKVLAAARQDGKIQLYRLGESIQVAASLRAPGPIERVRFVGGLLWVLSKKHDRVDVYLVEDADTPTHLGSFTRDAALAFRRVWRGPQAYSFSGPTLEVRRAEPVLP